MDSNEYRPCKACGSKEYVNAEQVAFDYTPDGKLIVEPVSCDMCNIELVNKPSKKKMH